MLTVKEIIEIEKFIANFPGRKKCGSCFGVANAQANCDHVLKGFKPCRKRIFLSFKFTGEDYDELDDFLTKASQALVKNNNAVFCSLWLEELFQQKKMSAEQIYEYCINKLAQNDVFLAFIRKEEESRGMLLELDEAIRQGKKVILFIKKGINGHQKFRSFSNEVNEYRDEDDLIKQLRFV